MERCRVKCCHTELSQKPARLGIDPAVLTHRKVLIIDGDRVAIRAEYRADIVKHERTVIAHGKSAVSRVLHAAVCPDGEKSVAADAEIVLAVRLLRTSLRVIGICLIRLHDRCLRAELRVVPLGNAAGAEQHLLVEGAHGHLVTLVSGGLDVGHVVTDGVQITLLRDHAGCQFIKALVHVVSPFFVSLPLLSLTFFSPYPLPLFSIPSAGLRRASISLC